MRSRLHRPILLFALSACSPSISDPPTRTTDLIQAWNQDLGALEKAVLALAPSERWLAVQALLASQPESATAPLCEWVPPNAKAQCEKTRSKITERPHLWGKARLNQPQVHPNPDEPAQPRPSKVVRGDSGPGTSFVVAPKGTLFPFSNLPPASSNCKANEPLCRQQLALGALRRNKLERSAAYCLQADTLWQSECFFRMAEDQSKRTSSNLSKGTFADAMRFCLAAGKFMPECMEQSIILYSLAAPAANDSVPDAWTTAIAHADALAESELGLPEAFQNELMERYWSSLLLVSTQHTDAVSGTALEFLPETTHRHLTAASAYQFVTNRAEQQTDWGNTSTDLEQLGQALLQQMARRSNKASPRGKLKKAELQDFWREDAVGDENMPATMYLGASRRTWSADPLIDTQICILEALARQNRGKPLLLAATQHPNAQIAWTAKRLNLAEKSWRRHKPTAP
jgi:hypothetical protein